MQQGPEGMDVAHCMHSPTAHNDCALLPPPPSAHSRAVQAVDQEGRHWWSWQPPQSSTRRLPSSFDRASRRLVVCTVCQAPKVNGCVLGPSMVVYWGLYHAPTVGVWLVVEPPYGMLRWYCFRVSDCLPSAGCACWCLQHAPHCSDVVLFCCLCS